MCFVHGSSLHVEAGSLLSLISQQNNLIKGQERKYLIFFLSKQKNTTVHRLTSSFSDEFNHLVNSSSSHFIQSEVCFWGKQVKYWENYNLMHLNLYIWSGRACGGCKSGPRSGCDVFCPADCDHMGLRHFTWLHMIVEEMMTGFMFLRWTAPLKNSVSSRLVFSFLHSEKWFAGGRCDLTGLTSYQRAGGPQDGVRTADGGSNSTGLCEENCF